MLLYTMTHFFVRSSIILFYMRIFPMQSDRKLSRILVGTLIFNAVYNFSFLIAVVLQCSPVPYFWTQWEGLHDGHCGNSSVLVWVSAVTGVVFDLWLMALPFPQLMALNLSWKKKVMGGIMFFVGAACVLLLPSRCMNDSLLTVLLEQCDHHRSHPLQDHQLVQPLHQPHRYVTIGILRDFSLLSQA